MPRVSRNYVRKDYSYLLNKLQNQRQESPVQPQPRISDCKVAPSVPVISPEARRRASLMGNKNMRYILSRITGEKHDRDCPCAAKIPDAAFDMAADFPGWENFCWKCSRVAVIREGLHKDLTKQLDGAVYLFRKMNASTRLIHSLFHEHGGQIFRIDENSLYIKVREDSWILQSEESGCMLYHNNYYVVEDDSRIISDGYHPQIDSPMAFHFIYSAITSYSWEEHVRRKRAEELAARQEEARNQLFSIPNYIPIPRLSFFYAYYLVADCKDYIDREIHRSGLPVRLVVKGRYPDTKCSDTLYRVRKKNRKVFLSIVEEAKDYSVRSCCFDYADFCKTRITKQAVHNPVERTEGESK